MATLPGILLRGIAVTVTMTHDGQFMIAQALWHSNKMSHEVHYWSFISYKRPMLDDEAKPKKFACSGRLPSSITEA